MYNINESDEFPQDSSYSVQRARQFYENMNNTNQGYDQSMSVPSRRRTAPARTYSPRTDIQFSDLALSERPSVLNHSHEVEMYNASRIPLSYNLRKNIPPEYSNSHMVAQYYPGSPNGYQQQGYRIPRASSPRNDYMYTNPLPPHELSTTSSEVPQQQYDRTMIGATSGTVVAILETDILDSSTDEDDVIKECENETVDNDIESPRKSSLIDSTSSGVRSCLRKLSGQLNKNVLVKEVKGLFDDSGKHFVGE
ncbi:unnamed protein product [Bursaphelenchus okinawaensis]|uniref:Uncharacterized protein n=1 Tax=Bursaphelenchus okinawaensis TaxID=465554 RepID=A0A811K6L8_9BILA|nr:unnamed protein product [Bursaphelenchus okinawaensis]CAG9092616.1 unnamed protein product [Bursaphelenchus okinawaensis]